MTMRFSKASMTIVGPSDLTKLYSYLNKSSLIKPSQEKKDSKNIINYLDPSSKLKIISVEHKPQEYFANVSFYQEISEERYREATQIVNKIREDIEINFPGWRSPEHWKEDKFKYLKNVQN